MSTRGDIIRGAGGLLSRNNKLGIGFGHPTGGAEGDIRINMVDGSPRLFARAGGQWYGVALQESVTEKFTLGTTKNYLRLDDTGIVLVKDHAETAKFGATTTVGNTSTEHVEITSAHFKIKDGTTDKVAITGEDIKLSGLIKIDSLGYIGSGLTTFGNICLGLDNSGLGRLNVTIGWRAGKVIEGNETYPHVANGELNTLIGTLAAEKLETGDGNTCIGTSAGATLTTGTYNTCIGYASDGGAAVSNQIAIGRSTVATGQYGIAIGDDISAATNTFVFGRASNYATSTTFTTSGGCTFAFPSDERRKRDIKDAVIGLDFINELKTRTFKWKSAEEFPEEWHAWEDLKGVDGELTGEKEYHKINTETTMHGFIAQEGKEVLDKYGVTDAINVWTEDKNGMQSFNESKLIIPLIKAVQELSAKIDIMQEEINTLKTE